MDMFGYRVMQLAGQLPTLLVLLTALVLAFSARRRLPGRARSLLVAGATVLLLMELVSVAWLLVLPQLADFRWADGGFRRFELLSLAVSVAQWIGFPIGLGMLVAAALAGRDPQPAPAGPWGTWTPPADEAPPAGPPGRATPDPAATPWGGADRPPAAPQQVARPD